MSDDPVIVFDGACVLCSGWTRFVLRVDRRGVFRLAAMQTDAGRRLLAAHGLDPADPNSFIVVDGGRVHTESAALLHVLSRFGAGWRVLATVLRVVPAPLRDAVYRIIARNRYRWFRRKAVCVIPVPEQRARFIE